MGFKLQFSVIILSFFIIFVPIISSAECINGDCENGKGTYLISPKSKYIGSFKNGKFHGHGTCYFSNGAKYTGQWKNGKMHGKGIYFFSSKSRYVGEFKDNMFHGKGTLFNENGKVVFKGRWERDKPVKQIKQKN